VEVKGTSSFGYSYMEWNSSPPQHDTFFLLNPLGLGLWFDSKAEITTLDGSKEGSYDFGYLGPPQEFFPLAS
jgi:hypothetical protein